MSKQVERFSYYESDCVGKGGFGQVYKGVDTKTGQAVAIKIMELAKFKGEFLQEALDKEIIIMKALQSDHVVKFVDVFANQKQIVIVLELCDGGDLRQFMAKNGGMLEEKAAQEILCQLMKGFQVMTQHGFIHRDIKPDNTLSHQGIHKISDFGFATQADITGVKLIKECVGTPIYMAPQLLDNKPYTAKCDIWSIGIMAYEMVYGRQPWPCRDCNSLLYNVRNTELKFPYEKQVSEQYKDFIRKCLVLDENARIGWDKVFDHPVLHVNDQTRHYEETIKVDDKSKEILHNIQKIVQTRGLFMQQCFQMFDLDNNDNLYLLEFTMFIQHMDPRLTWQECQHLFNLFDKNQDGKISLAEFNQMFTNYDYSDLSDQASRLIIDLKEIIKANNININNLFQQFDTDKQGDLDIDEFTKLVQAFAPDINPTEIKKIFMKFDSNHDNRISFDEFKRELQYGTNQDEQFNPQQERTLKVINGFKSLKSEVNFNLLTIFNVFDGNADGFLEFKEFSLLPFIRDSAPDDIKLAFEYIDTNKNGRISIEEFLIGLQ